MNMEHIRQFRSNLRILERESDWQRQNDVACCGVTLAQCHTIMELGKSGEIASVELAAALGIDPSTLSRHINGLVNLGIVNRVINPDDRRYVSLSLTETGRTIFEGLEAMCNQYYAKVFELIPAENHAQVLESFALFANALLALKEQGVACINDCQCAESASSTDTENGQERGAESGREKGNASNS